MKNKVNKRRVDEMLVELGLAESKTKAAALVMAGQVVANDQRVEKAGDLIPEDSTLRLKESTRFVSRAALKLESVFDIFPMKARVEGSVVLDVGASTGGFTQFALEKGARLVLALDVGTNQLAYKLRNDDRVASIEKTHIKDFDPNQYHSVDVVLADISFNSLAQLSSAITKAAPKAGALFLLMVKPQFELQREDVPDGGVVTDPQKIEESVAQVIDAFEKEGLTFLGQKMSSVSGRTGNKEVFVCFERKARY